MLKQHQRFFKSLFQFFDLVLVSLAWVTAYPLRFKVFNNFFATKGAPRYHEYIYLTFGIVLLWYLSFYFSGIYHSRRTQKITSELWEIARASLIAFVALTTLTYYLTAQIYSRSVLLIFLGLALLFLFVERIVLRTFMHKLRRRGFNRRNSILVGENELAAAFLERLQYHAELGLFVKGVVRLESQTEAENSTCTDLKLPILGTSANLAEVLRVHDIDQVILALKSSQQDLLDEVLTSLVDQHVDIRVIPDLSQFITLGCEVEDFEGLPLISLNQSPIVGWNRVAKRTSDIVYASLALILFSPLMLLISLAVKIFTPGPIIFTQERMGLDGHLFKMLKFRTMRLDAEEKSGAVWAVKNDGRVTWLGRFLRKTSLDELPQLINVLVGDMSCVGPRPERPTLVEKFKNDIPRYMLRHKVKAGMTGWAQINGWRGSTSLEKRIEYDLYYISHWSLLFDFKIMLMTIFKGFISKNAY